MALSSKQLKDYQFRFVLVVAISFILFLASYLYQDYPFNQQGQPDVDFMYPLDKPITLPILISIASLLTSVVSFCGFFFTTVVAWRKERREQKHADLDLERKKLEVEKLRIEIESKKREGSTAAGRPDDVI